MIGNTCQSDFRFNSNSDAFAISILQFPKTIVMIVLNVLPILLAMASLRLFPIILFFGLSVPAYVGALMYNKFFKKLEDQIHAANGDVQEAEPVPDEERIFHDELDATLVEDNNMR